MQSDYANRINGYIQSYHEEKGTWPLELDGKVTKHDTYLIPIRFLRYNRDNGRIAMEVREKEEENGHPIDPKNPEDAKTIRQILLALEEGKTEELEKDLKRIGQEQPGVITFDGVVINGNRRMAIFQELHEKEDGSGKWEKLEVIRLPEGIGNRELWKLEAGLQLSQRKVVDYHPVNELLKIKQGLQIGLTSKEMVDVLFGREEDEIKNGIERLNLIDNFLKFMAQPENYGLIKKFGLHEYFINVQKTILKNKDSESPKEMHKRLQWTYALLRANIMSTDEDIKKLTHMSFRQLGKIFDNTTAYLEFASTYKDAEDIKEIPVNEIIEGFRNAEDVLNIEAEKNRPKKLFERAIRALKSVDLDSEHFNIDQVGEEILELSSLIKKFKKLL